MKKSLKTKTIEFILNEGKPVSYTQIINFLLSLRTDLPNGIDISKNRKFRGYYSSCLSKPYNLENFKDEQGHIKKCYYSFVGYFRRPSKNEPRFLIKTDSGLYDVNTQ